MFLCVSSVVKIRILCVSDNIITLPCLERKWLGHLLSELVAFRNKVTSLSCNHLANKNSFFLMGKESGVQHFLGKRKQDAFLGNCGNHLVRCLCRSCEVLCQEFVFSWSMEPFTKVSKWMNTNSNNICYNSSVLIIVFDYWSLSAGISAFFKVYPHMVFITMKSK